LAIAACGSKQKPLTTTTTGAASSHSSKTVEIYSSLPESGPDAARSRQIETGIEFALKQAHHRSGTFQVRATPLCDTTPPARHRSHAPTSRDKVGSGSHTASRKCTGNWNPTAAADNAETAAKNPETVAYIGDLNSGATALSLPILNQAGIVQITPGSGYPGLTDSVPVSKPKGVQITLPGEPGRYYPRGLGPDQRTLLRMIPNDLVQASAELYVLKRAGCQKFSAWNFGTDMESKSLLAAVIVTALKYKMVDYSPVLPKQTKDYVTFAQALGHAGVRCAIMIGHVTHDAVLLTNYLANQIVPTPTIVGSSGFCSSDWVRGVSKNVVAKLFCTTPALPVAAYAGSAGFIKAYRHTYKRQPTAYSVYGYVATEMLLQSLRDIDEDGDTRQQVLSSMVDDNAPDAYSFVHGHISTFSFVIHGNLGADDHYGVDHFKSGRPQHFETVDVPATYLLSSG
jgi:branched-chain amino acid transport system substrate-binding protein